MPSQDSRAQPRRLSRQPSLTGLRAVAITLVVGYHLVSSFDPAKQHLLGGGILGVDLFFVLSGFLITTLLLEQHDRDGRLHPVRFYRDRALRLLPPVALLLVGWDLFAGLTHAVAGRSLAIEDGEVLTYSVNWFQSYGHFVGEGLYQTWSLSIEEQFYLVWPAVLLLAVHRRWSSRRLAIALLAAVVAVALWRAHMWMRDPSYLAVYYRTDARADSLLIGALASVAWRAGWLTPRRLRRTTGPLLLALLALVPTVNDTSGVLYLGGFTVVGLGAAVLIVSVVDGRNRVARALAWRPVVYLGDISYALYLCHVMVIFAVARYLHHDPYLQAALVLAISLPAAALTHQLLELPSKRLRTRLDRPAPVASVPHVIDMDDFAPVTAVP